MAEDVNPYTQFVDQENPYTQFVQQPPAEKKDVSTAEDVGKAAGPALLRGSLGAVMAPGTMLDLAKKGAAYGYSKVDPSATPSSMLSAINKYMPARFRAMPTYDQALQKTEQVTGPLYQAQTPVGRAVQGGIEAAPSLAMGGEGALPLFLRSAGAGALGEGGRQAAGAIKPLLPTSMQGAAEPVGQAIGAAVGGGMTPKAVTPFPINAERAATISALNGRIPMSAGQQANSPGLMALEARAPSMASMPGRQQEAFTDQAMQLMGSGGRYNPANLARGEDVGAELGTIRSGNNITGANFQDIITAINNQRRGLQRVVGRGNTDVLDELRNDVLSGAMNIPGQRVFSMPGPRYAYMRERIQNSIDAAPNSQEKMALANVREALDNAFYQSVPPGVAARTRELQNQYTNYNSLRGLPQNADRVVNETIGPMDALRGAASHMGNSAVNTDRGTLVPFARDSAKVMQEFPKVPQEEASPLTKLIGMGLGAGSGFGIGQAIGHGAFEAAPVGAIAGREVVGPAVDLLKNIAGRTAATGPAQRYLKNQVSPSSMNDREAIIRLLASPAENPMLSGQSK